MKMLSVLQLRNKKPNALVMSYRLSLFPVSLNEKPKKETKTNTTNERSDTSILSKFLSSITDFLFNLKEFIKI
jgi:hypothetical protein